MASFFDITGGQPLNGVLSPSGNKNEILPCLAATLLSEEEVVLTRVPRIGDVLVLIEILQDLGVQIVWRDATTLACCAREVRGFAPRADLCAKIRASILLLAPLLARCGRVSLPLPGGDVIGARRIDTHWEGITALGGKLTFDRCIEGRIEHIKGCEILLDEPSVTATENIILLAVLGEGETTIQHCACEPHVVGFCRLLKTMGANISGIGSNRLTIRGVARLHGTTHAIAPDYMEVGSFICLGAISGGALEIQGVELDDLRFIVKILARLGIKVDSDRTRNTVKVSSSALQIRKDIGNRLPLIYSGPWPAFPTDLMSVAIVAATQAHGTVIFFEKMFEGRMFFIDSLLAMGANIVLCDPHRVVVSGPTRLSAAHLTSPDVRAGMALLMAALVAKGTSHIDNATQIERGYGDVVTKLQRLGADIRAG